MKTIQSTVKGIANASGGKKGLPAHVLAQPEVWL